MRAIACAIAAAALAACAPETSADTPLSAFIETDVADENIVAAPTIWESLGGLTDGRPETGEGGGDRVDVTIQDETVRDEAGSGRERYVADVILLGGIDVETPGRHYRIEFRRNSDGQMYPHKAYRRWICTDPWPNWSNKPC
jgi:hypothetical protein